MTTLVYIPGTAELASSADAGMVRKQILPMGAELQWPGDSSRRLTINKDVIDSVVKNFKAGILDVVPFFKVDKKNNHVEDPELARGTVEDLEVASDGLYAHIRPVSDSVRDAMLSTKLGASAALHFGYRNHSDGSDMGVVLRHVAWTPEPWIPGMQTFEQVALSSGENADVAFLEPVAEGGKDNMDVEALKQELREQHEAALAAAVESVKEEMGGQIAELSATNKNLQKQVEDLTNGRDDAATKARKAEVDGYLSGLTEKGLPPAIAELARPIMLEHGGEEVVYLSAGENGEEERTTSVGARMKELLELIPKVDFSEKGESFEGHVLLSADQADKLGIAARLGSDADDEADEEYTEDIGKGKEIASLATPKN